MKEEDKRLWDVVIGFVGPLLTVAGIIIGIVQFNAGEENRRIRDEQSAIRKDDINFRRTLWLERINAYRNIAEIAGAVVAHANDSEFPEALKTFIAAYWGTMILAEDKDVEKAMINFYVETRDFESKWSSVDNLKIRADELITACQISENKGKVELAGEQK